MKLEDSFMATLTELLKQYPVLRLPNDAKVQVSVRSIIQMVQKAHKKGWVDSDPLSIFNFPR